VVLHFQGLKISKCKNVRPEWLQWGLGNYCLPLHCKSGHFLDSVETADSTDV